MEDVEELPTWAARAHVPGSNLPIQEPEPDRRRPWRLVLIGSKGNRITTPPAICLERSMIPSTNPA